MPRISWQHGSVEETVDVEPEEGEVLIHHVIECNGRGAKTVVRLPPAQALIIAKAILRAREDGSC